MAASTSVSNFPIMHAPSFAQSLFAKKASPVKKLESLSLIKPSRQNSRHLNLNVSRSSSTGKFPGQKAIGEIADGNYPVSLMPRALLSPVKQSKSRYVINSKYSIKSGKKSQLKQEPEPPRTPKVDLSQMIDQMSAADHASSQITRKIALIAPTRSNSLAPHEDERTRTPSEQSPVAKMVMSQKNSPTFKNTRSIKLRVAPPKLSMGGHDFGNAASYFVRHLVRGSPEKAAQSFSAALPAIGESYIDQAIEALKAMKWDKVIHRAAEQPYKRKYANRKLLLLDLDETLIHCTGDHSQASNFDLEVDFLTHEGIELTGYLNIRPYVTQFLANVSKHFEVVVFTASMKYYADRIVEIIDPNRSCISEIFYRESCSRTSSNKLVKDLTIFSNIPLEDILLVDNNIYCMWLQPQNGIPILHFDFNRKDKELEHLEKFLFQLKSETDHVSYLKKYFQLPFMFNTLDKRKYIELFL